MEVKVTHNTKTETKTIVVETKEPVFNLALSAEDVVSLIAIVGSIGGEPEGSVRKTASPIYSALYSLIAKAAYDFNSVGGVTSSQTTTDGGYRFLDHPRTQALISKLKEAYKG